MNNQKKNVPGSAQPAAPVATAQSAKLTASDNQSKAKELNKAFFDAARLGIVANPQQTVKNNVGTTQVQQTGTVAQPQTQTQAQPSSQPTTQTQAQSYSFDPNVDYQALINEAVAAGNYQQAAIYEQQRNAKIAGQGLGYEQTNQYSTYLPGGVNYVQTETTASQNLNDLSPMINQLYDAANQQITANINHQTQQAADQLQRAFQDAQGTYEDAIARQLIETKQAQDAQALRHQVNGDRGGIGSAQVDSIVNTGAKNREAIAAQQRQLSTDTARQLADLRAQGKYEEANQLLQSAQQRLAALYEEQVRLQQIEETKKSNLASLGANYLSSGLMPNSQMLDAMGIDEATAQLYIDYVNAAARNNGSYKGSADDDDGKETGNKYSDIASISELGDIADAILRNIDTTSEGKSEDNLEWIAGAAIAGQITPAEAAYLAKIAGFIGAETSEAWAKALWEELGLTWPYN